MPVSIKKLYSSIHGRFKNLNQVKALIFGLRSIASVYCSTCLFGLDYRADFDTFNNEVYVNLHGVGKCRQCCAATTLMCSPDDWGTVKDTFCLNYVRFFYGEDQSICIHLLFDSKTIFVYYNPCIQNPYYA